MPTMTRILAASGLVAALCLAAVPIAEAADGDGKKSAQAQLARGVKAWASTCGNCHNMRAPSDLSDEEWDVSVTHMRVRANLPGDIARDIAAYLKASN